MDSNARKEIEPFQVYRRGSLYAATAVLALLGAAALAVAASVRGPLWLWAPAVGLVILAAIAIPGISDAQTPIFVADEHGVRLHEKELWVGLLWKEMGEVVVEPGSLRHDPRIKIITKDGRRLYSTPVGFTTSVSVADAEVQLARRRAAASY